MARHCMVAEFFPPLPNSTLRAYLASFVNSFTGSYKFEFFSVLWLLCLYARLFICALWSPVGKGLTSWLSFVVSDCELVTFPLVSWIRCGI